MLAKKDSSARVAVYGTLMTGEPNHKVMRSIRGAGLVAQSFAITGALLYAAPERAPFPFLVLSSNDADTVLGELWSVPRWALKDLDAFEGTPNLYERVAKFVWDLEKDGLDLRYFLYVRRTPPPETVLIPEGSWREYVRKDVGRYWRAPDNAS